MSDTAIAATMAAGGYCIAHALYNPVLGLTGRVACYSAGMAWWTVSTGLIMMQGPSQRRRC